MSLIKSIYWQYISEKGNHNLTWEHIKTNILTKTKPSSPLGSGFLLHQTSQTINLIKIPDRKEANHAWSKIANLRLCSMFYKEIEERLVFLIKPLLSCNCVIVIDSISICRSNFAILTSHIFHSLEPSPTVNKLIWLK